jgi:predicted enzyme related to lactoylglutathione lyase
MDRWSIRDDRVQRPATRREAVRDDRVTSREQADNTEAQQIRQLAARVAQLEAAAGVSRMGFKAQLVAVNYPFSDSRRAQDFYGALMGVEMARSLTEAIESWHSLAAAGVMLTLGPQQHEEERNAIAHFAVADLNAAVEELQQHGGNRVADDFDMAVTGRARELTEREWRSRGIREPVTESMGRGAIVQDPEGNLVGLIQLEPWARVSFQRGALTTEDLHDHGNVVNVGRELVEV